MSPCQAPNRESGGKPTQAPNRIGCMRWSDEKSNPTIWWPPGDPTKEEESSSNCEDRIPSWSSNEIPAGWSFIGKCRPFHLVSCWYTENWPIDNGSLSKGESDLSSSKAKEAKLHPWTPKGNCRGGGQTDEGRFHLESYVPKLIGECCSSKESKQEVAYVYRFHQSK